MREYTLEQIKELHDMNKATYLIGGSYYDSTDGIEFEGTEIFTKEITRYETEDGTDVRVAYLTPSTIPGRDGLLDSIVF